MTAMAVRSTNMTRYPPPQDCQLSGWFDALDMPGINLDEAIQFFAEAWDIAIRPIWPALQAAGITQATKVTLHANNMSYWEALAHILNTASPSKPLQLILGDHDILIVPMSDTTALV